MFNEMLKKIDGYFADACDQTGLTVDEILAKYNTNKYELAEAMDQTGLSIEELLG